MSADMHQRIRLHAFRQEITLTKWANNALREYLTNLGERPPKPAARPELNGQTHGPMFELNPALERKIKTIKFEHGINACDWVPHVLLDKLEAEATHERAAALGAEIEPARYTEAEILAALGTPEVQHAIARALMGIPAPRPA